MMGWHKQASPFHAGEKEVQRRMGVSDRVEQFGSRIIRPFMPDQHRQFFTQLPYIVLANVDENDAPWASIVCGEPGFVQSPNDKSLTVETGIHPDDPLKGTVERGDRVGMLGLEFHSRRRNRMNGRTLKRDYGFDIEVIQSFGNCPQYIQTRDFEVVKLGAPTPGIRGTELSADDKKLIKQSDTFFVASFAPGDENTSGADASHRGGKPGFVKIEQDGSLLVPDYLGNFMFNTLGNFVVNPKGGVTFIDFETGDILMITGDVEIIWEGPEIDAFRGAQRAWRLRPTATLRLEKAMPIRWQFNDFSPGSLMTGSWEEAQAKLDAANDPHAWRPYRVVQVNDESSVVKSFYFEPNDGGPLPNFKPGQFATLRVNAKECGKQSVRTYTVSSSPKDQFFRISVKREDGGEVSNCLHDHLKVGSILEMKAPSGDFYLDTSSERPVVMLSAGIGITPMISMLRQSVYENIREMKHRPTVFIHSARNDKERALIKEANSIVAQAENMAVYSILEEPEEHLKPGEDYHGTGRLSVQFLQAVLPLADYDFYLCGPAGYMQAAYDMLRDLGVRDKRIQSEAFGPATMERTPDEDTALAVQAEDSAEAATDAHVEFRLSGFEQQWTEGEGSLLEFAENHGLAPDFGCRSGSCGSCKTKLLSGKVTYRTPIQDEFLEKDDVLLCCAVPAKDEDGETVVLDL